MEFEPGDAVSWTHVTGGRRGITGMTKVKGFIHEIKDGKARCRRGKNGKVDHWVPLEGLHKPDGDPLRNIVHLFAEAHRAD